jgi:hypothetical protein
MYRTNIGRPGVWIGGCDQLMAPVIDGGPYPDGKCGSEQALTPIHKRIYCAATPETTENGELGSIAIDHFLDELAKIVLAIDRRREQADQRELPPTSRSQVRIRWTAIPWTPISGLFEIIGQDSSGGRDGTVRRGTPRSETDPKMPWQCLC